MLLDSRIAFLESANKQFHKRVPALSLKENTRRGCIGDIVSIYEYALRHLDDAKM